jgi:uncharacterized protein (UPF0332 family)
MNSEHVQAELRRAHQALRSAQLLLDANLLRDAVSRSYYSVLHAARAALLSQNIIPESHVGVRRLFGLTFVQRGLLESEFGHILRSEQDRRIEADYDVDLDWTRANVETLIEDGERFLVRIETYLRDSGRDVTP